MATQTRKQAKKPKRVNPRQGSAVIWPAGAQARYGISAPTRWRWEIEKKLPPRDVFVAGKAIGWRPATLDAADRGQSAHGSGK